MRNYDLAVIGAGSSGISAALYGASKGLRVILIEKNKLGGTTIHSGELHARMLQKHAKIAYEIQKANEWGFEISAFELDFVHLKSRMFALAMTRTNQLFNQLQQHKIQYLVGEAKLDLDGTVLVNDEIIEAKHVLLATGSKPTIPAIPGLESSAYITTDGLYKLDELPKALTIIGGGVTAIETAFSLAPLGTEVTIIEEQENILFDEDKDICHILKKQLAKLNVIMVTNQQVTQINEKSVSLGDYVIAHEELFIACGRSPDHSILNNIAIEMTGERIKVNENFQTSISNTYAVGSLCDQPYALKNTVEQAKTIIQHILKIEEKSNASILVRSLNVIPEVATFGLNETQAKNESGEEILTMQITVQNSIDGLIEGEHQCFLKLIVNQEYEEVVGALAIGDHATEILEKIAIIVRLEGSVKEVLECVQHDFMQVIQQRKIV